MRCLFILAIKALAIAALISFSPSAYCQNAVVRGIAKKLVKKGAKEAASEVVEQQARKEIFAYGGKKVGANYVENAVGKQAARTVVRKGLYNEIEANGMKSILQCSMRRAAQKLENTCRTSAVKILNRSPHATYADGMRTSMAVAKKDMASQTGKRFESSFVKSTTIADNAKVVRRFSSKYRLSSDKQAKLIKEMDDDAGLAKLINENPELNIRRWLNTRNSVNKDLITRTRNGGFPPNAKAYAGNVYYFNPHLNSGLKARLERSHGMVSNLSYDDLVKLDKKYPNGVPFTKEGFPDFTKVAMKDKNGNQAIVDLGSKFTGTSRDEEIAHQLYYSMGNKYDAEVTWHHIENSKKLVLVPREIHELVRHAGGRSTSKLQ